MFKLPQAAQARSIVGTTLAWPVNMSPLSSLSMDPSTTVRYELRFQSLSNAGRGYAFPCDAEGNVDIDALSDRARMNYLLAQKAVGRDLSCPAVVANREH
jgi:hypothetical protein